MMLSRMSIAETPGERPAPDSACIDVMITRDTPNASCERLQRHGQADGGAVRAGETKPFQPRFLRWMSISAA